MAGRTRLWVRRAVVVTAALAVLVATVVYAGSELVRRRTYDVPLPPLASHPGDAAAVARGARMARILGCYGGCHGKGVEGALFFSEPLVADLVAPNLTRVAATYSDADLARAIRHGVRQDGTGLFVMPSASFYHLSDDDFGDLLAFLRQQPRVAGYDGTTVIGPLGRVGLVSGKFKPTPALMDHDQPRDGGATAADPVARGRYLARVACTECHGQALRGGLDGRAPSLAIVAAYDLPTFTHLLRTGEALGRRQLPLMGGTARQRFANFTDAEIAALHAYLHGLPAASE
jgi:mono/diheme cytochrome c family protein